MHCGNVDRVMGLASVQKLESIKVRKQSGQDVAAEMEENNSFVNGLDWMCAFAWALMKLTELIRKLGKAAWGFGGLSLNIAILVQELVMFLLSVLCLFHFASIRRIAWLHIKKKFKSGNPHHENNA